MLYTYKDLTVWQKALDLAEETYKATRAFPNEEKYGLISQMRRSAVSISSNIAEGRLRGTEKYCRIFFLHALGSAGELDTQVQISKRVLTTPVDTARMESLLDEVIRMLNKMIEQLSVAADLRT